MTILDLRSDTIYREQAIAQLDELLGDYGTFPVGRAQIYGLRQIARQEPDRIQKFARHQRERAERRQEGASLTAEIDYWNLVENLCNPSSPKSVFTDWQKHAPDELREENIPIRREGMTHSDRAHRNQLKAKQKQWLEQWAEDHLPAFFERFCAHALYRLGMSESSKNSRR